LVLYRMAQTDVNWAQTHVNWAQTHVNGFKYLFIG
jgi:hypothetical protein